MVQPLFIPPVVHCEKPKPLLSEVMPEFEQTAAAVDQMSAQRESERESERLTFLIDTNSHCLSVSFSNVDKLLLSLQLENNKPNQTARSKDQNILFCEGDLSCELMFHFSQS